MKITVKSVEELEYAAKLFKEHMNGHKVFAFYGAMGAGKTTFIKSICTQLGVNDTVTSPTFAIVNEYHTGKTADIIYHFDFYRIKKIDEIYDMGYEEYFYSGNICLIEWPELAEELLPDNTIKITIEAVADGSRIITLHPLSEHR